MIKMTKLLSAAIAGIVGATFAGSPLLAAAKKAPKDKPAVEKNGCQGKHSCKGDKASCKGDKASCKGKASCKAGHECKGKDACNGKNGCDGKDDAPEKMPEKK